jgi:hypothetical protein
VLSDRERATLHEIHCQLVVEDASFVQSFDAAVKRLPREPREPRGPRGRHRAYTVAIIVAVILSVLMLLAQSPGTALLCAATAGWLFLAQRWRPGTNQRGT